MAQQYDLIVKGGLLIDPAQGIHSPRDIAFHRGCVAAMGEEWDALPGRDAHQVIDASGRIVTPGLVDLHFHARPEWLGQPALNRATDWTICLDPDRVLASGVTTAVDVGSYGVSNFSLGFLPLASRSRTRLFAFLNPLPAGLAGRPEERYLDHSDVDSAVDLYERNRDHIVGIKVLLSRRYWKIWGTPLKYLAIAREIADQTGLPIMVHGIRVDEDKWLGGTTFEDILDYLESGDIITHCFGKYKSFIAWGAIEKTREAVDAGLVLDVGHGTGSFSFAVAERALDLGFPPATISSDLHQMNYWGPVYDLPTTMSKFLMLGMSLDDVVAKATIAPAKVIATTENIGTLEEGAAADAVIFDLVEGEHVFEDSYGNQRIGNQRLVPRAVIRDGIVYMGGTWSQVRGLAPGPLYPPSVPAS